MINWFNIKKSCFFYQNIFLIVCNEMLGGRLLSIHNIRFLIRLTEELREAIKNDKFIEYKNSFINNYINNNH